VFGVKANNLFSTIKPRQHPDNKNLDQLKRMRIKKEQAELPSIGDRGYRKSYGIVTSSPLLPEGWSGPGPLGRGTDREPACFVPECAGKHSKWLHEPITKGAASMNATCCMDTEDEDEGCISVIQCGGIDDAVDGWKMPEHGEDDVVEGESEEEEEEEKTDWRGKKRGGR
jgi:hypothetical protein